jgi:hypothetical protein
VVRDQLGRWWLGSAACFTRRTFAFAGAGAADHFVFAAVGAVAGANGRQDALVPLAGSVFLAVDDVLSFVERCVVLVIAVEFVVEIGYQGLTAGCIQVAAKIRV